MISTDGLDLYNAWIITPVLIVNRYLASHTPTDPSVNSPASSPPDLKLNLIYPCTAAHVKKYSPQRVRMVTETPKTYITHVRPYMLRQREAGRLNWVFNIIEGRTEQEDVILRDHGGTGNNGEGFLLLPDLNWDRKTMTSLHLLALVERRDIWSLRDLTKQHVGWLKKMRQHVLEATTKVYPGLEEDELKLYVHCECLVFVELLRLPNLVTDQPTYYHFHIHIVHVMLEAGATQATGKAFGLENLISELEKMAGGEEAGMADVSLTYFLGEASELWTGLFGKLKVGEAPSL